MLDGDIQRRGSFREGFFFITDVDIYVYAGWGYMGWGYIVRYVFYFECVGVFVLGVFCGVIGGGV